MTHPTTPAQVLDPQCEICGALLIAQNGDAVCPHEDDAEHRLTYWLDEPPTSNSDRYAMEQAARGVLATLRAQADALAEREAKVERLRGAAKEMVTLLDGPRDAAYHELLPIVLRNLRQALIPTQEAQP